MDPVAWTIICLCLALFLGFIEIFVPSGGLLGVMAIISLIGSVIFAFLWTPIFGFAYLLGTALVIVLGTWAFFKYWPTSVIGRQILLNPEEDPALQPDPEFEKLKKLVGKRGIVRSKMLLSGQIEVDGRRLNAMSDSMPLEPGTEIVVIRVDGINILVREAPKKSSATDQKSAADPKTEIPPQIDDPFA